MTEPKVVESIELQMANDLRQNFAELTHEYGRLAWAQRTIDKEKAAIEEQFDGLSEKEEAFIEDLNKKYGTGTLNVDTGEFTPASPA